MAALLAMTGCAAAALPAAASATYSRVGPFEPAKPLFEHTAAAPPARNTVPSWDGVVMHPGWRLPMVRYGARTYWNPVTVALYGLQEYNLYVYGGRRARLAGARRAADWLVRGQAADGA